MVKRAPLLKIKTNLDVYNVLRSFHKNILFEMIDILEEKKVATEWEIEALQTLSGVLYLCEGVFGVEK